MIDLHEQISKILWVYLNRILSHVSGGCHRLCLNRPSLICLVHFTKMSLFVWIFIYYLLLSLSVSVSKSYKVKRYISIFSTTVKFHLEVVLKRTDFLKERFSKNDWCNYPFSYQIWLSLYCNKILGWDMNQGCTKSDFSFLYKNNLWKYVLKSFEYKIFRSLF